MTRTSRLQHQRSSGEVRPVVLGFNDGIVSILALVAGITGALANNSIILLAGIVGMIGGATSMAIGGYISTKSEVEFLKSEIERERKEIEERPREESTVVKRIFYEKGLRGRILNNVVAHITRNKKLWLDVVLKEELGIMHENMEDPKKTAVQQGLSFVLGALIPIMPYFFFPATQALTIATIWSAGILFLVGALKTKLVGSLWIKSGLEYMLVGMLAAAIAYAVGSLVPIPVELY